MIFFNFSISICSFIDIFLFDQELSYFWENKIKKDICVRKNIYLSD